MRGRLASSRFDVTPEFLDSTSVYLRWPTTEAAEGFRFLFVGPSVNKPVAAGRVNLTSKEAGTEMELGLSVSRRNQ